MLVLRGSKRNPYKWEFFVPAGTDLAVNSLTAIGGHDRQLFNKLLWCLVSSPIFVRWQCLIARKIAELFSSNRAMLQFYEACGIDDMSRGFVLCLLLLASEVPFSPPQPWLWVPKPMTLAAAEAIQCECFSSIGRCAGYCNGRSLRPPKRPAKEVHLFAIVNLLWCITLGKRPCYGRLKKKPIHVIVLYYVLIKFVSFGPQPAKMDAVSATIVADLQARVQ